MYTNFNITLIYPSVLPFLTAINAIMMTNMIISPTSKRTPTSAPPMTAPVFVPVPELILACVMSKGIRITSSEMHTSWKILFMGGLVEGTCTYK